DKQYRRCSSSIWHAGHRAPPGPAMTREASSVKAQRLLAPTTLAAALLVGMAPHAPSIALARSLAANPPLIIDVSGETATLDPQTNYDSAGFPVLGNVYDGLVRAVGEKTVSIVPDLAMSWTHSPDGKTWTFKLRPGVTFHDG